MDNRHMVYIYALIALLMTIALYFGLKPLVDVPEWVLITDATLSGIILSALLLLLKAIVQYGHFSSLHIRQRLINYSALAILFVVCWLGLVFLISDVFVQQSYQDIFHKTVSIRAVIALLIYSLAILTFKDTSLNEEEAELECNVEDETVQANIFEPNNEIEVIERIAVKNGQKIEVIPIADIIHLQAEGDYVMIHSNKGKFMKELTMKSLENSLPPNKFVRVHRSNIVNVDFIARIEQYDKQAQLLKLKNGDQIRTSLSGYKLLKKTLGL